MPWLQSLGVFRTPAGGQVLPSAPCFFGPLSAAAQLRAIAPRGLARVKHFLVIYGLGGVGWASLMGGASSGAATAGGASSLIVGAGAGWT